VCRRSAAAPRLTVGLIAAVALLAAMVPGAGARGYGAASLRNGSTEQASVAVETHRVGLVTGDVVTMQVFPDGHRGIEVELAGRKGYEASYEVVDDDGDLYVFPSDVPALLDGVLDRELFNVTKLVEFGYDVERGLPVIVVRGSSPGPGGRRPMAASRRFSSVRGVDEGAQLESVGGEAVTVEGGSSAFWRAVSDPDGGVATLAESGPAVGVDKIWLDEQVEATLDVSVPMVGAPEAWAKGYDGTGLRIAVLDTGIDADHPDLAGKVVAEQNFSFSPTVDDRYGHGTHVAGIIAGSGAAAGGNYVGVAPGVELLNGKVLGDGGTGPASSTIDGMEWAATAGADVVNMSLGTSFSTDGNDPVSLAVDELTSEHDVLFVISAGNNGPGARTIGSPGAASAAVTVGAVDKAGNLPIWSSRGPRLRNYAIKPDITAPGAGIVAARAGGTSLGSTQGTHYTRLSGTSMAAPHVAGAAAILLQESPELSAGELKAALVTTAAPNDGQHIYQQGGGLLDIPAALDAPLGVLPAPLDLGLFSYPHDETPPKSVDVTYTNNLDEPLSLDLSFDVSNRRTGASADAALLNVEPQQLALEPGETRDVTVTVDVREGEFGLHGGYLVATDEFGEVVSRTPTGFHMEAPTYTLTVEVIDRTGATASGLSWVNVFDAQDLNEFSASRSLFNGGPVVLEVPHGTYSIMGRIHNEHPIFGQERSLVALPEVSVTEDTTVMLDARSANRIVVDTTEHDTKLLPHVPVTYGMRRETQVGQSWAVADTASADWPVYAAPVPAVSMGNFELFTRWLMGPAEPAADSVLYDLVLVESDGVPEDLHYSVGTDGLARVVNRYHSDRRDQVLRARRFVELPGWEEVELAVSEDFNAPATRTEYYTGGVAYRRQLQWAGTFGAPTIATDAETYVAGEHTARSWFGRPMRPSVREGGLTNYRLGNTLHVSASPWVDSDRNATTGNVPYSFFRDGVLVVSGTNPSELPLAATRAEYRLELSSAFERSWWQTSTAATTAWTLQSDPPPGGGPEIVPLLLIDYDLDIDLRNRAPLPRDRRGPPEVGIHVRHQAGADVAAIAGARLWTSYDDGTTWQQRNGDALGDGRYRFLLDSRDPIETSGFVSLKVEAWDTDGNRIEQEIIRGYALPPRDPSETVPPGTTERVSVSSSGIQANRLSSAPPAISADGRYVAFASLATNLVPGAPDVPGGVFLRDRDAGTTERVSVSTDGTPASGNAPAISPDGRYVAFASSASNLIPDDTNNWGDVFVHDRETGITERVSVASDGTEGNSGASSSPPAISGDGRYVAFASSASNLVVGDTNNGSDVFVHDRATGTTERVSVASDGSETGVFRSSSSPSISADGRYVAFASSGSNLVPDDTNNSQDIFVHDRDTATTERVSISGDGAQSNSFSLDTAMSADGRYVVYSSLASNLVADDTNGQSDMFVHDRVSGTTVRASVASDGTEGNGFTSGPAISADGRYVGFASGSTNLVPDDTNEGWDIFIHDLMTGTTERASVATDGSEANQGSFIASSMNSNGRYIAFVSSASNLVAGDTNAQSDVFVRDRGL
jgi:subtilisin family serine protease/Tol biopolymer transport system component